MVMPPVGTRGQGRHQIHTVGSHAHFEQLPCVTGLVAGRSVETPRRRSSRAVNPGAVGQTRSKPEANLPGKRVDRVDRCIVLVDAGYLLGAAASLLAGEPARSRITVDHASLIQGLRELAEADTQRPLLRIYWFDGAPDRVPQPEHRRLRVMPRVTVRLGALTRSDGRWAQKGVDAAMHAELTELARNRACSDVVLVTGDGDLLPGLMSAKEHGVAVHLWAVQAADGDYNQSEDLVAEADERRVLDRGWITRAVRAKDLTGICPPRPDTRPEITAILSAPLPDRPPS